MNTKVMLKEKECHRKEKDEYQIDLAFVQKIFVKSIIFVA